MTIDGQNIITGQLKFPNGSAAAPSIAFASDLTTGMYYLGSKHIGFSTGGSEIVGFNGNNLGSGQSGNVLEINTPSGLISPNPVGMITDYGGGTAPPGWLFCYGQSLLVASYPELFVAISNTYGGDGISTFFTPDCRGRVSYGKDNMGGTPANRITVAGGNFDGTVLGNAGGGQNQTLTTAQLPVVTPTFTGSPSTANTNQSALQGPTQASVQSGAAPGYWLNGTLAALSTTFTPAGTISSFGSGNSHPIINPGIVFNRIIYAGRA